MKLDKYLNEGSEKIRLVNFISKMNKFEDELDILGTWFEFSKYDTTSENSLYDEHTRLLNSIAFFRKRLNDVKRKME